MRWAPPSKTAMAASLASSISLSREALPRCLMASGSAVSVPRASWSRNSLRGGFLVLGDYAVGHAVVDAWPPVYLRGFGVILWIGCRRSQSPTMTSFGLGIAPNDPLSAKIFVSKGLSRVYTRRTFIASSPRWLITLTAMRPDSGLGKGREMSRFSVAQASSSISAFSVVFRAL